MKSTSQHSPRTPDTPDSFREIFHETRVKQCQVNKHISLANEIKSPSIVNETSADMLRLCLLRDIFSKSRSHSV